MTSATFCACSSSGVDRSVSSSPSAARLSEALNVANRTSCGPPRSCGWAVFAAAGDTARPADRARPTDTDIQRDRRTVTSQKSAPTLRVTGELREAFGQRDRKSTRLNSSHVKISYAVFCLKKKNDAGGSCL